MSNVTNLINYIYTQGTSFPSFYIERGTFYAHDIFSAAQPYSLQNLCKEYHYAMHNHMHCINIIRAHVVQAIRLCNA